MDTNNSLIGKTALVTGAQQGIGRAIAITLGAAGATVIANYLDDQSQARKLKDEVERSGATCHLIQADLSQSANIATLFEYVRSVTDRLDMLINNAAIFPRESFLSLKESTWYDTLSINLTAPFLCTQLAAAMMIEQGMGGSIVNITSGAAFRSTPRGAHYVASKAGLVGLTRSTALELAEFSIRVNAVAPGLTDTAQPRMGMDEQELIDAAQLVPLGKIATAQNIAPTVRFLVSDDSSHITGQILHVNGGQYLG